ncbi:dihydrofolate reductase family protein [Paenibacillus sp. B01]|uniref:dihydrofolate reductase family protein n=1 Tax=Paenibacillus sp. B01 TaxID=2660554 RepID=UPI00129AF966|nr:dihydrofolate reductase family protein [Paenibacillus sp. B01]QGG57918.1 dihydrofolate reductase [Paenibacillus sp. B01]
MGRNIILDLAVTLDGFIEGKQGETDWCIMDPDMEFLAFLDRIDTILYGRKSYELWGEHAPSDDAAPSEKELWTAVHSKEKYVFSMNRNKAARGAVYIHDSVGEKVAELKRKPGKDIWLYGGAGLIATFIEQGLVDEYRLSVHPVALGAGKPLFTEMKQRLELELIEAKTFSSGVVQLIYRRQPEQ